MNDTLCERMGERERERQIKRERESVREWVRERKGWRARMWCLSMHVCMWIVSAQTLKFSVDFCTHCNCSCTSSGCYFSFFVVVFFLCQMKFSRSIQYTHSGWIQWANENGSSIRLCHVFWHYFVNQCWIFENRIILVGEIIQISIGFTIHTFAINNSQSIAVEGHK